MTQEQREALLAFYRDARGRMKASLDRLTDAQMVERSLGEWSVKDILLHIAAWDEARVGEIERIGAGGTSVLRDMTDEQDEALNRLNAAVRWDLGLDQARWEFDYSRERLLRAIEAAPQRALDAALFGRAPLRSSHDLEHAEQISVWRGEKGY